jgi:probable rRNA maturation factor
MAINLQIDDPFSALVSPEPIELAARTALRLAASPPTQSGDVAITITDADTVQTLNAQYRGIDAPTDVLSFENAPDPDFPVAETDLVDYLGDIIIAYPVAQKQAERAGHTPLDELQLLTVHGILHLLGFDHDTPANKAAMWQAQSQILAALGLAHVQPTET